jgi:purine-nucleoside phosphorylase
LGSVGDAISLERSIDYHDIPHFQQSTAVGHKGRLLCGRLAGVPVVAMLIDDHINLMNRNPLVGINDDNLGPRFPDMSAPYDRKLGERALAIARREDFVCHRGVYIAMLGPTYETRAEIRMLRYLGGDAVGMSTVPEAIVAAHAGVRVLGLSTITNVCSPDAAHTTTGEGVVAMAETARDKLQAIVTGIVASGSKI